MISFVSLFLSQVLLRTLWMGASLETAIDEKRIYNSLPSSNSAYHERGFPDV